MNAEDSAVLSVGPGASPDVPAADKDTSAGIPAKEGAAEDKKVRLPAVVKSVFISSSLFHLVDPLDYEGKPFKVNGAVVELIKITKPRPLELSGIDIQSVGMGDVNTVVELLERTASPDLSVEDINNLDLSVITAATGAYKSFFMGMTSVM